MAEQLSIKKGKKRHTVKKNNRQKVKKAAAVLT